MKRWQCRGSVSPPGAWWVDGQRRFGFPPLGLDFSFSLPSSSWLFTTGASPWSRRSPGWLSAVPAERRGVRLPSGTRRRRYLQHTVCFVWFCMEQLRLVPSYDRCLWVLDQLKYFWFIFVCETTVWQTMFLSVEILHGTAPSCPKV